MAPGFSKARNLLSKHRALSNAPVAFHGRVSERQEVTGRQPGASTTPHVLASFLSRRRPAALKMEVYLHLSSSSYKTERFGFLRLSHWQSPQTCAPVAFSPVPSRPRTPATVKSGETAAAPRRRSKGERRLQRGAVAAGHLPD